MIDQTFIEIEIGVHQNQTTNYGRNYWSCFRMFFGKTRKEENDTEDQK